jgi:two-component system NtrC family response regulator
MSLQAKLLRFLQERVIERLGGRQEIPVDVRVVCATHQNLQELIQAGKFREDLYYRLAEIVMTVPPLRQRHGDPSLLAYAFVRRFVDEHKRGSMSLSPEAIDAIEAHAWPGNVRELENCIKRAVIMAETRTLRPEDLNLNTVARQSDAFNLRRVREEAEKVAIVGALGRANNNVSKAAEMLGVSRPTLYDMMERYGLRSRVPDSPEADPDGKAA